MSETNKQTMKWADYVKRCKSLNDGKVNCLEFAVAFAMSNLKYCKYSTIFRCGWESKDGKKSVYHVLPIVFLNSTKCWAVINYIPEVNDLTTLDIKEYNYEKSNDGLYDAAKDFTNYFLPKMSEHYGMHKRNAIPIIQIVKQYKFENFIRKFEGKKMLQTEVLKELFG